MEFNEELEHIKCYEAGKPIEEVVRDFGIEESSIIKLASNENPYGTSPLVIKALQENANKAYLYPDDSMIDLKNALAKEFDLESDYFIIGSGSDQVIELALGAKANKTSKILMAGVTFAMYEIYSKHRGASVIKTPSKEHNLIEFTHLYKQHNPDVIFLCVPNNPLGECLDAQDLGAFLEMVDKQTLVIIDGAYQEFATYKDSSKQIPIKSFLKRFSNIIYLGTFSKAFGLGGMRVGYGIANKEIISALYKLRAPFNITTLSMIAAIEALKDKDFTRHTIEQNFLQMKRYEEFAYKYNIDFIPSYTNFITFLLPKNIDSSAVCNALLKQGVIIRNLASYQMNAFRITIGTPKQNDILLGHLQHLINRS